GAASAPPSPASPAPSANTPVYRRGTSMPSAPTIWPSATDESAVFGIDDDKWGEAVHAAVQLKPGQTVEEAALVAFAKQELGSVKAPKHIHFYNSLPRSVAGKVHKPTLKSTHSSQPTTGDHS
ncbi:MAG: hypothetical protein EOP82_05950, partial [Variovorax sp.]